VITLKLRNFEIARNAGYQGSDDRRATGSERAHAPGGR